MSLYEFAIACTDEPEAHRKKEGDIIAVRPYPYPDWGKKAEKEHLIIILDGLTKEEALKLTMPQYNIRLDWYLSPDEEQILKPIKITKCRFNLPFDIIQDGWLRDLDFNKVRAKTVKYQPLKEKKIIIDTREKVSIIFDKHKKSFKYNMRKKI